MKRAIAELHRFAAAVDATGRPILDGVYFEDGRAVAADGFIMASAETGDEYADLSGATISRQAAKAAARKGKVESSTYVSGKDLRVDGVGYPLEFHPHAHPAMKLTREAPTARTVRVALNPRLLRRLADYAIASGAPWILFDVSPAQDADERPIRPTTKAVNFDIAVPDEPPVRGMIMPMSVRDHGFDPEEDF